MTTAGDSGVPDGNTAWPRLPDRENAHRARDPFGEVVGDRRGSERATRRAPQPDSLSTARELAKLIERSLHDNDYIEASLALHRRAALDQVEVVRVRAVDSVDSVDVGVSFVLLLDRGAALIGAVHLTDAGEAVLLRPDQPMWTA